MKSYDVIVIGGGLAGYYSALSLKKGGLNVALVEKSLLGGTGTRTGALPVKKLLDTFKRKKYNGENLRINLIKNWGRDILSLEDKIESNLIKSGIDLYFGDGKFLNDHRFRVGEDILYGDYIIIATGTEPSSIGGIKIDGEKVITHKEALDLNNIPEKIIILGGNVEGIEFAAIYVNLGVEVVIVEKEEVLLLGNDEDLVKPIEDKLIENKVRIIKGIGASEAYLDENRVNVILENGQVLEGDKVLVTLDRKPNFPKGIEKLDILKDEEKIIVDESLKTKMEHVYAIGDINGILGMGHGAIQQGIAVSDYILKNKPIVMNYKTLPRAVYTLPEMSGAGYQEEELIKEGIDYIKGYSYFSDTWRGWAKGIEEGFVKVLIDRCGKILGIWMVGEDVSEYIGLLGLAIEKNITVDDMKNNLIIHPTLWEAVLDVILNVEE